jgi:hypothetical protein
MAKRDDLGKLRLKFQADLERRSFPQKQPKPPNGELSSRPADPVLPNDGTRITQQDCDPFGDENEVRTKGEELIKKDELVGRLFPTPWRVAGKKGLTPTLPIDEFIRNMSDAGKLRTLNEPEDSHHVIICPFMIARTYVYRAFEEAEADERYGEWQRRERRAALEFSRKNEGELQRLLVYREESPESLWLTKSPTLDLKKLIASLQAEISHIESILSRGSNSKGDVWKIRFARTLGYGWRDLVGRRPAWTGEGEFIFLHFVRAAFQTVGDLASEPWDRQCRTAIEQEGRHRPPEERWDYRRLIRERPVHRERSAGIWTAKPQLLPKHASILDTKPDNFARVGDLSD